MCFGSMDSAREIVEKAHESHMSSMIFDVSGADRVLQSYLGAVKHHLSIVFVLCHISVGLCFNGVKIASI